MTALKCPICGAPLPPSKGNKKRKYCSKKCAQKVARRRFLERARANALTKRLNARRRLEERDAEYAASPCAEPVTVEERGGIRIETRGRVPSGWRSSSHVSHS